MTPQRVSPGRVTSLITLTHTQRMYQGTHVRGILFSAHAGSKWNLHVYEQVLLMQMHTHGWVYVLPCSASRNRICIVDLHKLTQSSGVHATQADVRVRRTIKWSKIGIASAKAYPVFVLWFALTVIHRSRSGET